TAGHPPGGGMRLEDGSLLSSRAVEDVLAGVRECRQQVAGLGGQSVLIPAARRVQPPDLTLGFLGGELVQHGEHWGCPDPGRDQDDRFRAVLKYEVAARGGDVEDRALPECAVQVSADQAVLCKFDADPVRASAGR